MDSSLLSCVDHPEPTEEGGDQVGLLDGQSGLCLPGAPTLSPFCRSFRSHTCSLGPLSLPPATLGLLLLLVTGVPFIFISMTFYFFWLCWVFVAARGLFLVVESGGYSLVQCVGFSLRWLLLLQSTDSRRAGFSSCGSQALESRLSSCGARALLLHGMWDLPRPGLKPVSPALAGEFLTTVLPLKSQHDLF